MKYKTLPGINIQWPISRDILSGKKVIETRTYPLPSKYINQPMYIIETPGKGNKFKSRVIGEIIFSHSFQYKNSKEFYLDISRHLVDKESPWAWKKNKPKWGWHIISVKSFDQDILFSGQKGIVFTTNVSIPLV